ncbi:hypothetical protein [Chondrinema litorale]|uniref:hypothetical protein n=1 Tax=Chondrinema litorale TaxID=2994555 RepID=UPI002543BA51|nr:hypothetical protein [Chondrinema litorale]UZR94036.1 hypothetical protein OQ292_19525 [Chondrinema litorale]
MKLTYSINYKYILLFFSLLFCKDVFAQKFLVLDNYGRKRIKLSVGDDIYFKQVGNSTRYHDYIVGLGDSSLVISTRNIEMKLNEFDKFYFPNHTTRFLSAGTGFIAGGFLFAAAVAPLVSEKSYDQQESAIIGSSFLLTSAVLQLFKWKKFKVKKNSRVRIIDTTFRSQ